MNGTDEILKIVMNQTPEVYEQALRWGTIDNWVGTGVGAFLLVVAVACILRLRSTIKKEGDQPSDAGSALITILAFVGGIALIIGFFMTVCCAEQLVKIRTTPKLYVVERMMDNLK